MSDSASERVKIEGLVIRVTSWFGCSVWVRFMGQKGLSGDRVVQTKKN